jgi:hypothetical protein
MAISDGFAVSISELTQIPIQIILGDNIPAKPDPMPWRVLCVRQEHLRL